MTTPHIHIYSAQTNETIVREMTNEEYAELVALGWTDAPAVVEPVVEETPVVDDLVEGEQP